MLVQAAHDTFERMGDDLWHRHAEPLPAERNVLFAVRVPFLDVKRNWLGPIKGGREVR